MNNFKITLSRKGTAIPLICFLVIEVALIFAAIDMEYPVYPIMAAAFFLLGLYAVMGVLLFSIEISGSNISVRTRIGRRYNFGCSDIEKVTCYVSHSDKYGKSFYIELATSTKKLDAKSDMTGFENMAGYILGKLENGEIKHTAVSESCKRRLCRYKSGNVFEDSIDDNDDE